EQVGAIRMTDPIGAPLPLDPGGFITGDPPLPGLPGLPGPTAAALGPLTGSPAWIGLGPEAAGDPPAGSRIAPAVVPAPGAALLLLGAAMTASRRRRRG
ncbi:MAG: PEP-CTERM sorting domain-containing protein, partial [Planctomycetota bacterium]